MIKDGTSFFIQAYNSIWIEKTDDGRIKISIKQYNNTVSYIMSADIAKDIVKIIERHIKVIN